MRLKHLQLLFFRNFHKLNLSLSDGGGIFYGRNAQGKTNLLESIFLLAYPSSFRALSLKDCVGWERDQALVSGTFEVGGREHSRKRVLLKDGKTRKEGWQAGSLPIVLFSPEDLELIKGGAENRRGYVDDVLSQTDFLYHSDLKSYERALLQKNRLISLVRSGEPVSENEFLVWEEQLAEKGCSLMKKRQAFIPFLEERVAGFWTGWLGMRKPISILYKPSIFETLFSPDTIKRLLKEGRSDEVARGRIFLGPHRDEIEVYLEGHLARETASQGEQRMLSFFFRLAERDWFFNHLSEPPLLLLDDVFSELDSGVCFQIVSHLQKEHQVIVTAVDHTYELLSALSLPAHFVSEGTVSEHHVEPEEVVAC